MALNITIRRKGIISSKKVDINYLFQNTGLRYGYRNEFGILEEGKSMENCYILYNPAAIGRGIFLNASKGDTGEIQLQLNFPTTESEVNDFLNIISNLNIQLKKIEIISEEENRKYNYDDFMAERSRLVIFSIKSLKDGCCKNKDMNWILPLAMWPLTLTQEQRLEFAVCSDLKKFEKLLHEKQALDVYYAKPRLYNNKVNNSILAVYVLTEECESIFPISGTSFLNIEVNEVKIQFYIYSENCVLDGLYDYDRFIRTVMEEPVEYFDADHIKIKSLSKVEITELVEKIR